MFVAVEGLDGVGKSTVARGIAVALGADVYAVEPSIRVRACMSKPIELHYLLYLWTTYQVGREIGRVGRPAIADSYALRTVTAHEAMGVNRALLALSVPLLKCIQNPELTFLLTCKHNERVARLEGRGKGIDEFDILDIPTEQAILDNYEKWGRVLGYEVAQMDTSFKDVESVVGLIIQSIK